MSIRLTADGAEVRLDDGLERFVRDVLADVETAAIRTLRAAATQVASDARRQWYGRDGVQRVTGKSGKIETRETVDLSRGAITFSVGSTDDRRVGGKPVPAFVHRPGRTSTILKVVSPREYFAAPEAMRGPWLPGNPRRPQLFVPNPGANDGAKLIEVFIRRPMRKAAKAVARQLGEEIGRG